LSQHFSDRTVVTYDPRGVERSVKTDPASPVTPDVRDPLLGPNLVTCIHYEPDFDALESA